MSIKSCARMSFRFVTAAALLVIASTRPGIAAADLSSTVRFDIAPQPLSAAILKYSEQSGVQVASSSTLLEGKQSAGVVGSLPAGAALDRVLSGTGLKFAAMDANAVVIRPASATGFWQRFRLARADQEGDGPAAKPTSDSESGVALEEVLVTAQKRSERLQDVPVPVTAISGQSLASNNQLRLQDYYTRVPGLSLTTSQPFGSSTVAIRGVVTGYFQSPTVGITVDDVPYTSSTTVGFGNVVSDFDPSDLARVEVLRGPQGTLYGASSMGGLIKYVTVDPSTEAFTGQAGGGVTSISNGDEAGYSVRGAVNVPLSDNFAFRASAFTRRDPGYIDDPANGEEGVNWGRVSGGRLSTLWNISSDWSLKLNAVYQDTRVHGSSEVDAVAGLGDLQQNRPPNSGGYDKKFQVYSANVVGKIGLAELTSISAYARNENLFKWDFSARFGALARDGIPGFMSGFGEEGVTSIQDVRTNKFTQEIRLNMPLGERTNWLFGVFYGREKTPHNLQVVPVVVFDTNQVVGELAHLIYLNTFQEYAAFTDLTFRISDRFDVQVGGRESRNEQDFQNINGGPLFVGDNGADAVQPQSHSKDNAFTYLLTPRFKLSPDFMAYARFASGYRPGGPNGGVALNVNLPRQFDPDTTRSYEVGVKGATLSDRLSFDVSLYYIDWRDIQLQLTALGTGISYYDNAGRARSQGLETALELRPATGLVIAASGTWTEAELSEDFPLQAGTARKGDRLPFTSRFAGNVSVDQDFPLTDTFTGFVGASLSYVGARPSAIGSTGPQRYPSYTKTDLRAGLRSGPWTANLFANNLTDKRGILNVYAPHGVTYIQPRTIGVSVDRTF